MLKNEIEDLFKEWLNESYLDKEVVKFKLIYENKYIFFEVNDMSDGQIYFEVNNFEIICDNIVLTDLYLIFENNGNRVGQIKLNFIKSLYWDFDY